MRVHRRVRSLSKVLLALITFGGLISYQNVSATHSSSRSTSTGISAVGLVILFSVIPHHVCGRSVQNGSEVLYTPKSTVVFSRFSDSSESEDVSLPSFRTNDKKETRSRVARQLGFVAPALQTMGCLPKFFCGMNSKPPSDESSTLNDLAYLIKFAMLDEPDSEEKKGKDGLGSEENSDETDSEESKRDHMFEHMADQELIMDDPEYLSFMWKDMKQKLKNKLKDGKSDDEVLQQMMDEIDYEDKTSFRLPSLFSGLSNLVRFGRSVPDNPASNKTTRRTKRSKSFWDTEEFDEQMKLAARIGKSDTTTDQKCTSTFNLCPFSIGQMKNMITGTTPKPTVPWYLNSDGPKGKPNMTTTPQPPRPTRKPTLPTVKPNKLSHLIYAIKPESVDGRKPVPQFTTTKKPNKKPYLGAKPENEDDETGYDSLALNLELPTKNIKVIKLQQLKEQQKQEQTAAESLEEILDGFTTSSEEENKDIKLKVPKRPVQDGNVKTKKKPSIGLPRPKYSIRNKRPKLPKFPNAANNDKNKETDSPENEVDSSQEKEDENSSEEKDKKRPGTKNSQPKSKPKVESKQTKQQSKFKTDKESEESKEYDEKKTSSEEKPSSEEQEVDVDNSQPQNNKNQQHQNSYRHRPKNHPSNKNRFNQPEYSASGEPEYSDEGQMKETIRPISYSYFNSGKPRPTEPVYFQQPTQHYPRRPEFKPQQNHGFNTEQQRPGNNDQQRPGVNHQSNNQNQQRPTSKPGFFSSIFGGNKRPHLHQKPTQHDSHQGRPPTHSDSKPGSHFKDNMPQFPHQHSDNQRPPPQANLQPTHQSNQNLRQDDNSEENVPEPHGPPPPPVPQVFGSGTNPGPPNDRPSQQPQPINRPGLPSRVPTYHYGNPNRPQNQQNPRVPQNQSKFRPQPPNDENEYNIDDTNKNEKSEENSESKEDDKKSEESKESSEETGGHRVKDIFSKSSIATLGSDDQRKRIPPPPPVANFRPKEISTTTTTTPVPLPMAPIFPPKPTPIAHYAEEDSAEDEKIGSPENKTVEDNKSEEDNSEEMKKFEDDESENREPSRHPFNNEQISELGQVITMSQQLGPSMQVAPLPPVSNFMNNKNQIKVPMMVQPLSPLDSSTRQPIRNPADGTKNTNSGAGPMSPGGIPNPGSGSGMRPGMGGGNRRPNGNNNRRPMNNGQGQESSEENSEGDSSEETIGGSSEEDDVNSKRGRTSINLRKVTKNSTTEDKPGSPIQFKPDSTTTPKYSYLQSNIKPIIQSPYALPSLSFKDVTESSSSKFSGGSNSLPPIYKWRNHASPTPRPKPKRPVKKQSVFSKPLNPKMVQYLRETYGNAVRIPDRATTSRTTDNRNHKNGNTPKRRRRPPISHRNEDDEITNGSRQKAEDIHFDEFFHVGDGIGDDYMSRRQGEAHNSTILSTPKPKITLPPIYGKQKRRRRH